MIAVVQVKLNKRDMSKEKSQNVNMSDNSLTKNVRIKIVKFNQLLLIKMVLVNNWTKYIYIY